MEEQIKQLITQGLKAMDEKNYDRALQYYKQALKAAQKLKDPERSADILLMIEKIIDQIEEAMAIKSGNIQSYAPSTGINAGQMVKFLSSNLIKHLEETSIGKIEEVGAIQKEYYKEKEKKESKEDLEKFLEEAEEAIPPQEAELPSVAPGSVASTTPIIEKPSSIVTPEEKVAPSKPVAAAPKYPAGPAGAGAPMPQPAPPPPPSPPAMAAPPSAAPKSVPRPKPAPAAKAPAAKSAARPPPAPTPAPSQPLRKPEKSKKESRREVEGDEARLVGDRGPAIPEPEPAPRKRAAVPKKIKRFGDVSSPMEMTEKKEYIVAVCLRVLKEDVVGMPVPMEIVVPVVGPPIIEVFLMGQDFKVDQARRSLIVPLDRDSDILNFRVTPKMEGLQSLTVEFYQEGRLIGRAILKIVVKRKKEPVNEALSSTSVTVASYLGETKLDASLRIIRYENDFFFSLFTPRAKAVVSQQSLFGKATIDTGKVQKLEALVEEAVFDRGNPEEAVEKLKKIGTQIYNYIPEQIRKTIKSIEPKYLMIETGDLLVPWELAFDGSDFLCIKYCLGKRVFDETKDFRPPPFCIGKKALDVLFVGASPKGVPEISVNQEMELFDVYAQTKRIKLEKLIEPNALKQKVVEYLSKGDIVHLTCHGNFEEKEPKASALLLSDSTLTASEIDKLAMTNWPLIFANACSTGAISNKIVGIGGIARSFLEAGAIAFLGPLFEIPDDIAVEFAKEFYNDLLFNDMNVGEAILTTRKKLRDQFGGAFWAIFSLYGDPTLSLCSKA